MGVFVLAQPAARLTTNAGPFPEVHIYVRP